MTTLRSLLVAFVLAILTWKTNSQETAAVTRELTVSEICDEAQSDCGECIRAHPECTWCYDNTTTPQTRRKRCGILSENEINCKAGFIANPKSSEEATRNDNFSVVTNETDIAGEEVIQLRPQGVTLKLRKGQPQKVNFTFERVVDYPLDLYFVMDLSFSMGDDLDTLQNLGSDLVDSIRNLTSNVRLGFGTFVDKVMLPFASTLENHLKDPCSNQQDATCAPVFGFRHQLPVTANGTAFRDAVQDTEISGNIDTPEGGFDALMQIAVCQEEIAWRQEAFRVILYTTDASPHIAMDGKLAAVLEINDMKCHLETNIHPYLPEATLYSKSKLMDYPSIGQLKQAFDDNGIRTIFAVTEDVLPLYEDLPNLLTDAFVSQLNNDSSNVVAVISTSYNALRTKVRLTEPTPPSGVDMSYRVLCPGTSTWIDDSLECSNASIGDQVTFEFEFTSSNCPDDETAKDSMIISSTSIRDVVNLTIEYICECDCLEGNEENSEQCSNSGNLTCGICSCDDNFLGLRCQCTAPTSSERALEQNCTELTYIPGVSLCNDRGFCDCGTCDCNEDYYGPFCECRSSGCPVDDNDQLCGGPEKGVCENCRNNLQCKCNERPGGWTLNADTKLCSCNEKLCKEVGTNITCSEHGTCECDKCACETNYGDTYCQRCIHPDCTPIDGTCGGEKIQICVECVYQQNRLNAAWQDECNSVCQEEGIIPSVYDSFPNCDECLPGQQTTEVCDICNRISIDPSVHIQQDCEINPFETCTAIYRIVWDTVASQYGVFVRSFDSERDCPTIDPLVIVLPVVGGILLVGLIALIAWKILQTIRDKREYERFEKEASKAKWASGQNDLYVNPNDRIQNPMFVAN